MKGKRINTESRSTNQKKKSFFEKVKEHKTEIIIVGVTIVSAVGAILIVKNWNVIKSRTADNLFKNGIKANDNIIPHATEAIENSVISIPSNGRVIDVSKHIRNLPESWKASAEKLDSAKKAGFVLGPHQTWVDDYSKLCA